MHFQISLSLWELQVIRDWLCVRDINETSLNKLLLFLILKSSRQSCSVEKRVLRNFTGKYLCWSLFLKKSEGWGPATQVFFHWNLQKILRFFFFFFKLRFTPCVTTRHRVTRKKAQQRLQDTENLFRKNLQLKDVCWFWT